MTSSSKISRLGTKPNGERIRPRRFLVLDEELFGLPKPHPNAVLNLFGVVQGTRFAMPIRVAYQVSLSGFSTPMSNKFGTMLSRHALASTIRLRLLRATSDHVFCNPWLYFPPQSDVTETGVFVNFLQELPKERP